VAPPRLAASPAHLECRLLETKRLGTDLGGTTLVIGAVVHVAADDGVLDERGNVDPQKATLVARLGGAWYTAVEEVFAHRRPEQKDALRQDGD
jgi:flavin reductase (DIM6/NTAB) family NADH-FMN oxidoreductase RutF